MKWRLPLAAVAALATVGCVRTVVEAPSQDGFARGMSVVGVGRVDVRPDTLVVALGVEATAPTAPEALEAMTSSANSMIDAIRDAGVAPEDVQTVSLSVREVRPPRGPIPIEGIPVEEVTAEQIAAEGFVGEQRLRVRIRDLEKGGEVIESAVQAAGPDARVFNMSLEVEDPEEATRQARQRAVEDALARAEELAEAGGVELGTPIAIEEIDSPPVPSFEFDVTEATGGAQAAASAAPDIQPGVRELEVRVQVRFAIEK